MSSSASPPALLPAAHHLTTAPAPALHPQQRSLFKGFATGATAACMAATFTNPWEVVKTRLQLQGELIRSSKSAAADGAATVTRVYTSAPQAFMVIARAEGLRGLQRGLFPAYLYQAVMNGTRLGGYDPAKRVLYTASAAATSAPWFPEAWTGAVRSAEPKVIPVLSGFLCGIAAALLGSPLFLVKTRMQSYSTDPRLMGVGAQHKYRHTGHALAEVVREGGVMNLWRGVTASMMRTGVGSAVQLSSYDTIKDFLLTHDLFQSVDRATGERSPVFTEGVGLHFCASMITGLLVAVSMNPFDVVSTRLYNQKVLPDGTGALYRGPIDCFAKTLRAEGISALYKGLSAHYLRVGPHTILTFVFLEQVRKMQSKYWP
ncbi:Mitochondrial oxaloacetate carrier protein [Blastocladiella emersonii ATCC 22665]|nr:Mitochondrial oxaloacetate carrier protein [Blastocladiella emersonii ATCC 22665]